MRIGYVTSSRARRTSSSSAAAGSFGGGGVGPATRVCGHDVHRGAAPLEAVLGPEVAAVYRDVHTEHGVVLEPDANVEAFRGGTSVEEVVTSRGPIAADLVVVGIGAQPRVELASAAGLAAPDGIAVDAHLRTSDANVFAAGDVASAHHPHYGTSVRVEHWANALNQGLVAGRNLAGGHEVYDRLPYFFSDQYDVGMEYVGYAARPTASSCAAARRSARSSPSGSRSTGWSRR